MTLLFVLSMVTAWIALVLVSFFLLDDDSAPPIYDDTPNLEGDE